MSIERKLAKDTKFKKTKLAKTRARREALHADRCVIENVERSGRNDLLPELKIKYVSIEQLRPSLRKVRRLAPEHVARIANSIADLGFTVPMLVRGEEILDGHARLSAARKLGLTHVSIIDCSHLSDTQARKLALAANRLAELGEWDIDKLRIELRELIDLDVELEHIGFTAQEQDIILLDPQGTEADHDCNDEPPLPPSLPTTQVGDIWMLNEHRVICGNALDEDSYAALLDGEQAHLVLTDPPYNVKIKGNVSGLGKKVHDEFVMASGELAQCEWKAFLETTMERLAANVRQGSILFVFMDWRSSHLLVQAGLDKALSFYNLVIWNKQSGGMGAGYRSAHELLHVFCKGKQPRCNNILLGKHGRDRTNIWSLPGANRRGSSASEMLHAHATPKPVPLCVDAILDFSNRGEIVLDAFLGSGATLIAAEKSGRVCRGIELDPRFVDVAVNWWETYTGKHAILAGSGETFDEVRMRRSPEIHSALLVMGGSDD